MENSVERHPSVGDFVEIRRRPWLVEGASHPDGGTPFLNLSCISDDAQGDQLDVVWSAEIAPQVLSDDAWGEIARDGTDDIPVFASYLRTLKWNTATSADRHLLQSPFRAGIRLDAYQLLPLRKALRLPRVNLLIADDVGLGKTIEAGLIVRELLLRRRIDMIAVAAPPSMTQQWQDELEAKFGLSFTIIDRERLAELRRLRGFGVNPWSTGSRFIISHRLLTDETYTAGLRDILGSFRPRSLLILDEAHNSAPASGAKYAIDSQFTQAIRDIAPRFEHRLFLTATPHNGHSNSFSALLEILDPQRFTRGVPVRPRDLEPIMVRRLKADLRAIDSRAFPERRVEPVVLDGLPDSSPELVLSRMLMAYADVRDSRLAGLPPGQRTRATLVFIHLQQRLLSSVAAFARTLEVHRRSLAAALDAAEKDLLDRPKPDDLSPPDLDDLLPGADDDATLENMLDREEDDETDAITRLGAREATRTALADELEHVDRMLAVAKPAATRPDARVDWIMEWVRTHMLADDGTTWTRRRLILFTEYEDTRRWLQKRLLEALAETDRADARVETFTGATGADRREAVKAAFTADPDKAPVRILLCTDAAREGINLQSHCHDLIHVDLPWNPSRLEQRNGRIDRKLQPSPVVTCRYFVYAQRAEDVVLRTLVEKTERIRTQLGSVGQVVESRISDRLTRAGIRQGDAAALGRAIDAEEDDAGLATSRDEMDDERDARISRLKADLDDLRRVLEDSRRKVGIDPGELRRVVETALGRSGVSLDAARADTLKDGVETFRLDPALPLFANDPGWTTIFDDLRPRKRGHREPVAVWRQREPARAVAFEPPIAETGADAADVVQIHLEHRFVRRLLSRFLSQGFQARLNRVCALIGPGAQPRLVMVGRLAVYGPGAARLHEEFIPVTALIRERDWGRTPLKALGQTGEATTMDQLEDALRAGRPVPESVADRVRAMAPGDSRALKATLNERAASRLDTVTAQLETLGAREADSLKALLVDQRARIARTAKDADQLELWPAEERRQRERDRRHWAERLTALDREIAEEPARVRDAHAPRAHRVEAVGLVYLWPATG
ncbi:DISARM system SNF2-like helicase DrmD [Roseospira goensis]|uniref:ERCC4-related helicase n=1 Tax=Roseospira goensis TaxID=391922 RepID=A0A7W6WM84_9PROT|nr:DISARM system SNF2-like helicase DrmD [Roseospira goensis]MBB4287237.1 ERCC4-related helicase [Roseospira goensis]